MCKLQFTLQKIEDDGGDSMINRQCQDTIEQDDVLKKDDFDKLFIINPLLTLTHWSEEICRQLKPVEVGPLSLKSLKIMALFSCVDCQI